MSKFNNLFLILFLIITILDLFSGSVEAFQPLRWFFKPMVMLSLTAYYAFHTMVKSYFDRWVIGAFTFAFYGDVLLIKGKQELFFLLGVGAFAVCHIIYIYLFRINTGSRNDFFRQILKQKFSSAAILLISLAAYILLFPKLGAMNIPVLIYIALICTMALAASTRRKYTSKRDYWLGVSGAVIFMASDAILAIDKFFIPFPMASVYIMGTYAIAQYLIAHSFIEHSHLQLPHPN